MLVSYTANGFGRMFAPKKDQPIQVDLKAEHNGTFTYPSPFPPKTFNWFYTCKQDKWN